MKTSDKVDQISAAMFAVQRDTALPVKNTKGQAKGNREYRYLDLPGLIDHLKTELVHWALFVTQEVAGGQGFVEVTTTIWHGPSGQFIELGPTFIVPRSADPQDAGAAITYARRYALAAAFNLAADEDTDAADRGSMGSQEAPNRPPSRPSSHPAVPASDTQGEGLTRTGAANYLSAEDQALLGQQFGSKSKAVIAYRKRFGERIKDVTDVTYEMRDELESGVTV